MSDAPPTDDSPAKPSGATPEGGPAYALAQRLVGEKVPRDEALRQLRATGLDEEAAQVVLNAAIGDNPSALPEVAFNAGTNVLAPNRFSVPDVGISGDPLTVASYWLVFGAALTLLTGLYFALPALGIGETSRAMKPVAGVGLFIGLGAVLRGVFRVVAALQLRRR